LRRCIQAVNSLRIFITRQSGKRLPPRIVLRREHQLLVIFTILVGIAICVGLLAVFDAISSRVQSVALVSSLTERVEFVVTQPRLAAIPVRQMRIASDDSTLDGKCISGLILPGLNANVIYGRVGYGPLSIRIVPSDADRQNSTAGEFDPGDGGKAVALKGSTDIETDQSCPQDAVQKQAIADPSFAIPLPLPIWGKARIGSEFKGVESSDPDPRLLLSGQIKVSAQAVELLSGRLGMRTTLYPVTNLDLPVGSRLEAYAPESPKASPHDESSQNGTDFIPNWWGTAYVDSEKPALNVELATDTAKLALFRPNQHDPEIIEVSRLNQVFEDPNLIKVYKLLGVFSITATLGLWLIAAIKVTPRDAQKKESDNR
jgi:hypothetical protein